MSLLRHHQLLMSAPPSDFFPTGAILWLDAADTSTMSFFDTNKVVEWRDKSGNANHFTTVNNTNGPAYVSDGLVFNNTTGGADTNPLTTNYLLRGGFVPSNPYMLAVLDSVQSKPAGQTIYSQYQDSIRYRFVALWTPDSYFFIRTRNSSNYTAINSSIAPGATRVLVTGVFQGTNYRAIDLNDSGTPAVDTSAAAITPVSSLIGIERPPSGSTPAGGLVATLREVIMWSGAPDPAVKSAAVSYLNDKWSLGI